MADGQHSDDSTSSASEIYKCNGIYLSSCFALFAREEEAVPLITTDKVTVAGECLADFDLPEFTPEIRESTLKMIPDLKIKVLEKFSKTNDRMLMRTCEAVLKYLDDVLLCIENSSIAKEFEILLCLANVAQGLQSFVVDAEGNCVTTLFNMSEEERRFFADFLDSLGAFYFNWIRKYKPSLLIRSLPISHYVVHPRRRDFATHVFVISEKQSKIGVGCYIMGYDHNEIDVALHDGLSHLPEGAHILSTYVPILKPGNTSDDGYSFVFTHGSDLSETSALNEGLSIVVEFVNPTNQAHDMHAMFGKLWDETTWTNPRKDRQLQVDEFFDGCSKIEGRKRHVERMTIEGATAAKFSIYSGTVTSYRSLKPGGSVSHRVFTDRREVESIAKMLGCSDEIEVFGCKTIKEYMGLPTEKRFRKLTKALQVSYDPARDEMDLLMQENMQNVGAPFESILQAAQFFRQKLKQVGVNIGKLNGREIDEIVQEMSAEMDGDDIETTRTFAKNVIDEMKTVEEKERLYAERVKLEQEEISRRGLEDSSGVFAAPAKKSKNKKKRREEKERIEQEQAEKEKKERMDKKLDKRISVLDEKFAPVARVKQVFKSFTSNVLKCRQVNKVRSLLHKAGVLADCRKRGSHSVLHGENQQSITFVRPHGANAGVNAKALENNIVAALQGA